MNHSPYRSISIMARPDSKKDTPLLDGWYIVQMPLDWSPPVSIDDVTGYVSVADWWEDRMITFDPDFVVAEVQFLPNGNAWLKVNGLLVQSGVRRDDWMADIVDYDGSYYEDLCESTREMMGLTVEESVEPVVEHLLVA